VRALALAHYLSAAEQPKLIVLDLTAGAGVEAGVVGPLSEALTVEVGRRGFFAVVSQRDVTTLLGLERQKQLLGCSDESQSCLAELSGALGARFVISGSIARLGEAWQLTLTTLDTTRTQPLGRATRLARDLATLQAQLPWAVAEATATPMPPPPSRLVPYALIGGGTAAILFGGVWGMVALSSESRLGAELTAGRNGALLTQSRAQYEDGAGAIARDKAIALAAVGTGAALLGLGLWLNPAEVPGGAVALVPTGNGAAVVGVFP
jgi:hypothetical protein